MFDCGSLIIDFMQNMGGASDVSGLTSFEAILKFIDASPCTKVDLLK